MTQLIRWTHEREAELYAKRAAGVAWYALGVEYSLSIRRLYEVYYRYCRRVGIPVNINPWHKTALKWTPEALSELLTERRNGSTIDALAARYGVSSARIWKLVDKAKRAEADRQADRKLLVGGWR